MYHDEEVSSKHTYTAPAPSSSTSRTVMMSKIVLHASTQCSPVKSCDHIACCMPIGTHRKVVRVLVRVAGSRACRTSAGIVHTNMVVHHPSPPRFVCFGVCSFGNKRNNTAARIMQKISPTAVSAPLSAHSRTASRTAAIPVSSSHTRLCIMRATLQPTKRRHRRVNAGNWHVAL